MHSGTIFMYAGRDGMILLLKCNTQLDITGIGAKQ